MELSTKILFFILCLSGLNILKHVWKVYVELRKEEPQKVKLSVIDTFILGCSISYILTIVLTGINI